MWAQIVTVRIRQEREDEYHRLRDEMEAANRGQSGGPRMVVTGANQRDPEEHYTIIAFDSEEAARAYEQSSEQQARIAQFQSVADGPPSFVDLVDVETFTP